MKAILNNLVAGERKRMMYCSICGAESSADKNDYFLVSKYDFEFTCCGEVMEIVTKRIVYSPVK